MSLTHRRPPAHLPPPTSGGEATHRALAWVGGRSLIRVTVEFEADEREARARGWRIVCGLLDMAGEDTPDAFLLGEVP